MTAKSRLDDERLGQLARMQHDLFDRVRKGVVPFDAVKTGLQALIEGRFVEEARGENNLVHGLFAPIEEQAANIREWNTWYEWGFTKEQIDEASQSAPEWPEGKLIAVVLVPYLKTVGDTFDALWSIASGRQKNRWKCEGYYSEDGKPRLLEGIKHPGQCLRWEVIDLGANWDKRNGVAPKDVRSEKSPHAGILAAAAHHPTWVKAMDGQTVPHVWAAGYECGNPASPFVPFVDFYQHGGQISLAQHCVGDRGRDDAVPAFAGE